MQAADANVDSGNFDDDDDDGHTSQPNDQPGSQNSTPSDHEDQLISENEKFHELIRHSTEDGIKEALLNKSIDINRKNAQGDTSLHVAVRRKNTRIVELLIRRGAVNIENNHYKTPLKMAEERVQSYPENTDLKSIHELLQREQPGTSAQTLKRSSVDGNDSSVGIEPKPKLRRISEEETGSSGLRLNFHGPIYQTKLLALFVQRALNKNYEFGLASEWEEAEKFDDIVLKYKTEPAADQWTWRFAQAKHKKKKRITKNDLMSKSDKNDFGLTKYFMSFCKIKSRERFKENGQCEDFTIITNTEFDPKFDRKSLFEDGTNLDQDPILCIEGRKPRKFKLRAEETKKHHLLEAFRSNLYESVLKSKEIEHWKFCKEVLTTLDILPNAEKAKELLPKAKEILDEIVVECSGEKRKTKKKLLKWAKSLKEYIEKFLNERNHQELFDSLKEIITELNDAKAIAIQADKFCKNIISKTKNVVETAKEIVNNCLLTFANYNNLESEQFRGLENDKKELIDDEIKLRNIRKEMSKLDDITLIKELLIQYEDVLVKNNRILKKTMNDLNDQNDLTQLQKELNEKLRNLITEISAIVVAINNDTFKNNFDDFIRQFCIITNYPNEEGLSEILQKELSKEFNLLNIDLVSASFEREMINFLKKFCGHFYSGQTGRKFLNKLKQKVGSLMSTGLCESYTEQLEDHNIRFQNDFTALSDFLSTQDVRVLHLSDSKEFQSTSLTRLCAIRVFRHLAECRQFTAIDSYIFIRLSLILHHKRTREFILNSFQYHDRPTNIFDLCVIECRPECREGFDGANEREQELCEELTDILLNESGKSKKLILITPYGNTFAEHLCNKLQENSNDREKCLKREHEIKFSDLDDDSQNRVLAKKVNFQGNEEISFNQLVDDKNLADQLIDSENLLKLIENKLIQIGDEKPFRSIGFREDYYIERHFNDQGNNSNNLSEINLVELEEKVKLLANDSGMGKSTTLTSVARNIRDSRECTWIFRINLCDYVDIIDTIKFTRDEINECIRFLTKMLFRGKIDANIRIQRELLKVCLDKDKNAFKTPPIILLIDGFDEISPDFVEKTTTLLISLKETNASELWITTRPHEKEHLGTELESPIFYLQPLEKSEQKDFLNKFLHWHLNAMSVGRGDKIRERNYAQIRKCLEILQSRSSDLKDAELSGKIKAILGKYPVRNTKKSNKFNELKEEIKTLSFTKYVDKILAVLDKDNEFHDTPQNLKILVEVICAENQLIEKFDRFHLYDKFVNIRFKIFYHIKLKMMSKNVGVIATRSKGVRAFINIHSALAVRVLFRKVCEEKPLPDFEDLKNFEKETERNESDTKKQKKEKETEEKHLMRVGLLNKRQDRYEFIHHSYAEFFFSKYLMKYLENEHVQTIFIENILFETNYSVIRQFFNDQIKEPEAFAEKLNTKSKQFLRQHEKHIFATLKKENHHKIINLLRANGLVEDIDNGNNMQ